MRLNYRNTKEPWGRLGDFFFFFFLRDATKIPSPTPDAMNNDYTYTLLTWLLSLTRYKFDVCKNHTILINTNEF